MESTVRISVKFGAFGDHGLPFGVGLRIEATEHLSAHALDGAGRNDAFRRAAGAHHDIDVNAGIGHHEGAGHVAVGVQGDAGAGLADFFNEAFVTGLVEHEHHEVVDVLAHARATA